MRILFVISLLLLILTLGCTQQTVEDPNTPQTVTGRVVTSIEEPLDSSDADYDVCNNAHTNEICDKLDIAFKNGYKKACCEKYTLCC